MNKILTKLLTFSVGLAMAIGVGVALKGNEVRGARADEATYSMAFTTIGETGWSQSYNDHGVVNDNTCSITLKSYSKQSSTIQAYPVTKAGDTIVVLKGNNVLTSVTFSLLQWGSKGKTVSLEYSTNGGSTYSAMSPAVSSNNFSLTSSSLPSGTNAVKMVQSDTGNQVGLTSISFLYEAPSSEKKSTTLNIDADKTLLDVTKNPIEQSNLTITVVDEDENVLTNPSISFESSNPAIATVSDEGVVTPVSIGKTNIIASYYGDDDYLPSSNEIEITVFNPNLDLIIFNSTNAADLSEAVLISDINSTSVLFEQNTGTYTPVWSNTGSAVRVYYANSFTITSENKHIDSIVIGFGSGDGSNSISADCGTYSNGTWDSNDLEDINSVTFTIGSQSGGATSGHRRISSITINYVIESTEPIVKLVNLAPTTIMLNKNGSQKTIEGLTASSKNIVNPIYIWSLIDISEGCDVSISGSGTTPNLSLTKIADSATSANFTVKVGAHSEGSETITYADTTVTFTVKPYGGSISWTPRNNWTYYVGFGVDFSTLTFSTTMNDGATIDYGSDFSSLVIQYGSTSSNLSELNADSEVSEASDLNGNYFKLVDNEHNASSSVTQVNNDITVVKKATITSLLSAGGISEIEVGQKIYLSATISDTGWYNTLTYTSLNTEIATVSDDGTVTGVKTGTTRIRANLDNGENAFFDLTVSSSVTYSPSTMYNMLADAGITSNQNKYGTKTKDFDTYYYRTQGYYKNDKIYEDSAMTSSNYVSLYSTITYATGYDSSKMVEGAIVTIKSLGFQYYDGDAQFNTAYVESIVPPPTTGLTISGANEIYKGEELQLGFTRTPSTSEDALTWSASEGASITQTGKFTSNTSGTYTVRLEVTNNPSVYAEKVISVFEYYSTELTLKNNPKKNYVVEDNVESDLVSAVVTYKCGDNLNYKTENIAANDVDPSYEYNGVDLVGSTLSEVNENGADLIITSALVEIDSLPSEQIKEIVPESTLKVENVIVEAVKVSSLEAFGTIKTAFTETNLFTFGPEGAIQVNYNNGDEDLITTESDGIEITIGGVAIRPNNYYLTTSDSNKTVIVSYGGKTYSYSLGTVSPAPDIGDGYYQLVTSTSDLASGSKYIIVNTANSKAAGEFSTSYLASVAVEFDEDDDTKITDIGDASEFTLGGSSGSWTFTSSEGQLYSDGAKNVNYSDDGTGTWTIGISNSTTHDATITNGTSSYGSLQYNSGSPRFTTYTSSQSKVQLYKFHLNERTDDEKAVDTYIEVYMHFDDVSYNNHSDTGACRDSGEIKGYYTLAKEAYIELTDAQKLIIKTYDEFLIARTRERLSAWAIANGETFDPSTYTFAKNNARFVLMNFNVNNSSVLLISIISSIVTIGAFAGYFYYKKKKDN